MATLEFRMIVPLDHDQGIAANVLGYHIPWEPLTPDAKSLPLANRVEHQSRVSSKLSSPYVLDISRLC